MVKKSVSRVTIIAAKNGWVIEATYVAPGEFCDDVTWVEQTANAATDRALQVMTTPPEEAESAQQ